MGFWKEMFSNLDEPAITFITEKRIRISQDDEVGRLKEENNRLRKRLMEGNIKAINISHKLLE